MRSGVISILMIMIMFVCQKFTVMRIYWSLIVIKYHCYCIYVSFSIYVEAMSAFGLSNFCSATKRVTLNEPEESYTAPGTYIRNNYALSRLHCGKESSLAASIFAISELSLVPSVLIKGLSVSDPRLEHPQMQRNCRSVFSIKIIYYDTAISESPLFHVH